MSKELYGPTKIKGFYVISHVWTFGWELKLTAYNPNNEILCNSNYLADFD